MSDNSVQIIDASTPSGTSESGYAFDSAAPSHTSDYVWPAVERELAARLPAGGRVFDLGCGNGALMARLAGLGYEVVGVDTSPTGIAQGRKAHPTLCLEVGSAYDMLAEKYGKFDAVVSIEVIEHVYAPRAYAATIKSLLRPGGVAVLSTPYHGYLKNLVMAITGQLDAHFTVLWDHGHIKFWSRQTLSQLLVEAGFEPPVYDRVGRIPLLAKSMVAITRRR